MLYNLLHCSNTIFTSYFTCFTPACWFCQFDVSFHFVLGGNASALASPMAPKPQVTYHLNQREITQLNHGALDLRRRTSCLGAMDDSLVSINPHQH